MRSQEINGDKVLIREEIMKDLRTGETMTPAEGIKIFTRMQVQAELFVNSHPLFYDESGIFWLWNPQESYYRKVDEIDILNSFGLKVSEDIISSKTRTEIINSLKQVGRLRIPKFLDNRLIQFKDGLYHLNDPTSLLVPNPNYFVANPIPWKMGESEDTPTMDYIFKQWVGEKYAHTLYEIIAYCLLADLPIHRLFCLVGGGRNGKSSFLSLVRKFIGDKNVTTTDLDTLLNSRFEVGRLHKKLVCEMGETNLQEMDKTQLIKKLTGGDLIGFEYKNKMPFEDRCYSKLLISTNTLPPTADKSDGFYIRWVIIPFPNQFNERIDVLSTIPQVEYENLARKSLRLLKGLLERRSFSNEGELDDKRHKYEELSNPVDKFFSTYTELDGLSHIGKGEIRNKLNSWLFEHRHRAISDMTIKKKMDSLGVEDIRITLPNGDQPRVWSGIKWKK